MRRPDSDLARVATALPVTLPLAELEQLYLGLAQISGDAVLIVCAGVIVASNRAACELLALPPDCHNLGLAFLDFISPSHQTGVEARLGALNQPGQTSAFVRRDLLLSDQRTTNVEVAMHSCTYLGRPAVQILLRNLSESRRLQEEVVRLARSDTLTNLSNRIHFLNLLDSALGQAQRVGRGLAVAHVDLDNFRAVNDTAGQHGGDFVLIQVAERLRRTWNEGAQLARLGGDEFGLVLESVDDPETAAAAAGKLMEALSGPFCFGGTNYFATVSIGMALYPQHARRRDRLLSKAMLAMKFAKSCGGNQFQLYSESHGLLDHGDAKRHAQILLRLETLTPREREVLDLLVTGKSSKQIAHLLGVSARTIEIHRGRVMSKMEADSVAELVHMALERHR